MKIYAYEVRQDEMDYFKGYEKVVKVPVGVISLRDYGLLDGSSIIKQAKQLIQK